MQHANQVQPSSAEVHVLCVQALCIVNHMKFDDALNLWACQKFYFKASTGLGTALLSHCSAPLLEQHMDVKLAILWHDMCCFHCASGKAEANVCHTEGCWYVARCHIPQSQECIQCDLDVETYVNVPIQICCQLQDFHATARQAVSLQKDCQD